MTATLINGSGIMQIHVYSTELGVGSWNGQPWGRARLATESIGNMSLTLTNMVQDSTYEVEVLSTGAQVILPGTADATGIAVLSIPVYTVGDAKNTLKVKVRKASASPYYQSYETQVVAALGSQSLFINQLSDE